MSLVGQAEVLKVWGYATLTIDRFGPRGLKNTCIPGRMPKDTAFDAYQALDFLVQQPFVDAARVFVVGFSQGGFSTSYPSSVAPWNRRQRTNSARRLLSIRPAWVYKDR